MAVAFSGGRDSTALLHATARAARELGLRVIALHVHHGLMPQADAWLQHAQDQCRRWARSGLPVTLLFRRLKGAPAAAQSVEAWARQARYDALAQMAREGGAPLVLLAHHRQDQAETFLLQALRTGSARGLASMPRQAQRQGLHWVRPWLDHEPSAIAAYVRRWRLGHVEDGSNADPRFARSRLRTQVWPALGEAFPQAGERLAAAARRAQETAECLAELAAQDTQACAQGGALRREPWLRLSPARRANLLRHWLAGQSEQGLPETLVQRLLREWPAARGGARWPAPWGELLHRAGALQRAPEPEPPRA
ncbi:MAG: tRNA lysidine(34) synthetase TilS [Rubrivivax sp.]|nr:tRNA lysidine(34) synthetase TilS [Rubrivivax sp.]